MTRLLKRAVSTLPLAPLVVMGLTSADAAVAPDEQGYLAAFVGCWSATGRMGGTSLAQRAEARMALNGKFLEMHVRDDPSGPVNRGGKDYSAIYLIGFDPESAQFVFNLFDSFGVAPRPVAGLGKRTGDRIDFTFAYQPKEFRTAIIMEPSRKAWRMEQRSVEKRGSELMFAIKSWARTDCD